LSQHISCFKKKKITLLISIYNETNSVLRFYILNDILVFFFLSKIAKKIVFQVLALFSKKSIQEAAVAAAAKFMLGFANLANI
jgi:hypothetical protein